MAFANRFAGRQIWPGREWEKVTFATTPEFETPGRTELDERAQAWYQIAMNAKYLYGTAKPTPGEGRWYTSTFRDGSGAFLVGGNTYKLHVAPNVPAKAFWSVTIYDNRTRSMIDTDQQRAGRGSRSDLTKNTDGSIDLYFSPAAPKDLRRTGSRRSRDKGSSRCSASTARWRLSTTGPGSCPTSRGQLRSKACNSSQSCLCSALRPQKAGRRRLVETAVKRAD